MNKFLFCIYYSCIKQKYINGFFKKVFIVLKNIYILKNSEVLQRAKVPSVRTILSSRKVRWLRHVTRTDGKFCMADLQQTERPHCNPKLRYIKTFLRLWLSMRDFTVRSGKNLQEDQVMWRAPLHKGASSSSSEGQSWGQKMQPHGYLTLYHIYCLLLFGQLFRSNAGSVSHERICLGKTYNNYPPTSKQFL